MLGSFFRRNETTLERLDGHVPLAQLLALERAGVLSFRQALPQLTNEFDRARRYERALAIAMFTCQEAGTTDGQDGVLPYGPAMQVFVLTPLLLRETARGTDIVTFVSRLNSCLLAMPETGSDGAVQAMVRLRDACAERLQCSIQAGVAAFPGEGLTLEELIHRASDRALAEATGERRAASLVEARHGAKHHRFAVPGARG